MNILIIDAQGGGIGRQLISHIKRELPDLYITAVGTNSMATTAMLKRVPIRARPEKTLLL